MEAKGAAVETCSRFVLSEFRNPGLTRWLAALSPTSRAIMTGKVLTSSWYPAREGLVEPTEKVMELFYGGDVRGAWQMGRYSADHALHGVYKAIVGLASPETIVDRGTAILAGYLRPVSVTIFERASDHFVLRFTNMDAPAKAIDYRIAGWMERALEICGAKRLSVTLTHSAADGQRDTEIVCRWQKR